MELLLILLLFVLAWFWIDSLEKRERAIHLGGELAEKLHLQLLDDTVVCARTRLGRNRKGHLQLLRTYTFDISANGQDRLHCHLILLGNQLTSWHIPPYLQSSDAE